MNPIKLGALLAVALIGSTPAMAQPPRSDWDRQAGSGWNRDEFWRGAPENVRDRIGFLQRRIDRGIADGSLNRREARSSQRQLDAIRRAVRRMRGDMSPQDRDMIQARLDNLSQRLRWRRANDGYGSNDRRGYDATARGSYDDSRFATDYDAARYYREDPRYTERRLSAQDEVYRGSDGRYYCKRSDGTTGLIVGAIGGGVLGNVIDGGHNRAAGTLIGGALGALAGKAIDQNSDVRCR